MSVFRFSPEGSWSINDFQRNSPPFPFPCAAVAFSLVLSLSKTPLSSFFILFLSFFGCFSTLLPFCFAFGLPLNCPYTIYLGMWQCIRKQREGGEPGAGGGGGSIEGELKKLSISFCFDLETAGWVPLRRQAAWLGDGLGWVAFCGSWRSPSVMEVPCSVMVQVGFPSAPYRAMSRSPTPSPPPLCPQINVEGEEPPECETLLCSVFLSLFPYIPAKPSVQPLSLSSAPFADPFLLQKLMSLPVHVTLKGAAGRDRDMRCVSCTEDAPTSQSLAAFLPWSFGKGPGTAQGRAGFVPGMLG